MSLGMDRQHMNTWLTLMRPNSVDVGCDIVTVRV